MTTMTEPQAVYTVKQVASLLGCDVEHVARLIYGGQLQATNIGLGRIKPRFRIFQSDLDEFNRRCGKNRHSAAQPVPRKRRTKTGRIEFYQE